MSTGTTFREIMKDLRTRAGLSQAGLAKKTGISLRTIQNWEAGRNVPRGDALLGLAVALGATLADFAELLKPKPKRKRKSAKRAAKQAVP